MHQFGRNALILLTLITAVLLSACSPRYIKGTQVKYTAEKQKIADTLEYYRKAVIQRDTRALRELTSDSYYENGSTTVDASDDYDRNGFETVLTELKEDVKAVKYDIDITDINVVRNIADVDFEFRGQYLFVVAGQERWNTHADKNRIRLRKENGAWRILSGM